MKWMAMMAMMTMMTMIRPGLCAKPQALSVLMTDEQYQRRYQMTSVRLKIKIYIYIAVGIILGFGMAIPACYGGGAVTIIPDKHQLAPRGSYIPERRVKRVLEKVKEHQTTIHRQKDATQQENRLKTSETPAPQSPKEK